MSQGARRRILSAGGIVSVGYLTTSVHLYHIYTEQGFHTKLLGIVIPLTLSIVLLIAGVWLYWSQFDDASTIRVAAWTGVGLLGGVVFGYPVVPYQAAHEVTMVDIPFLTVNWITAGALGGFLIGFYNARQRQYRTALEAERAELAAREQELERQNDRLEQFASLVSHDLRNPLNVAAGRLEFAQQDCQSDHLDTVDTALKRMETLIDDLLTLARQGEPADDTDRVTLSTTADQAWAVVDTKQATLRTERDLTFTADPDRLQQLFENLFRNSIEHAGEDVTVRTGALPDQSGFYVEDDGPGIPEDDRNGVFTSGYSTTEEGTGLGLAIVSEIVGAHDWAVNLIASKDGGARFEISEVEVRE
ncbi:sensor histidine kinase [Halopenitus sp. H-Gu1]|uniref:sensor histidine kinase n=1 Tax=Halopenitus sp. H-Gu1 TaxID=3242697 RepID=UPI00359D2BDF